MTTKCRYGFLLLLVAFAGATSAATCNAQSVPTRVDFCQLTASAANYNGQYLVVHGIFEKDHEANYATNPDCKRTIALARTEASDNDPGLRALMAVYYCPPAQGSKLMSGDFVGRFEFRPGKVPTWVLYLDRVFKIHIQVDGCGVS